MPPFTAVEKGSILAIVGAVLLMLGIVGHFPPSMDKALHRAIGLRLAQQALNLSSPAEQIVVITRDTEAFPQPAVDALLGAFQAELHRAGRKPASVRQMQVDPLRPVEVPAGDFSELIRRAQPGQVLVSLLGPPLLSEEQWARHRPLKSKIVAFCPGNFVETVDLGRLFESGFLHGAIVSRRFSAETLKQAKRPGTFDDLYVSVTASNRTLPPSGTGSAP